ARLRQHQAETALVAIVGELQANREATDQALRYHQALLDSLLAYQQVGQAPSGRLFSRGYVAPAQVYETAWTSATETGVLADFEYARVLELSGVYARQEAYTQQALNTGQIIYEELYRGGGASIVANYRNLAFLIGAFVYREQQLVALYDQTLEALAGAE
ncbi:MAG: hypothetical protein AAF970_07435, partial [Bacteroidota bacterium]